MFGNTNQAVGDEPKKLGYNTRTGASSPAYIYHI